MSESINHPAHYGGDTPYEAIKVIEAWGLGFCLGNAVKYIARAGKKDPSKYREDLEKAVWYLNREISLSCAQTVPQFVHKMGATIEGCACSCGWSIHGPVALVDLLAANHLASVQSQNTPGGQTGPQGKTK